MNCLATCFRWVVVVGILVNFSFALPGIFIPNAVFHLLRIPPTLDPIWPAFASVLLFLLSLFYLPGAVNPFRHTSSAWLSVLARFAGVFFFFCLWPGVPLFGLIDLTFGTIEGVLLFLALRRGPDPNY